MRKRNLKTSRNGYQKHCTTEAMDSQAAPFIITQPEFMRRMKGQSGGGGMFGMGNMPEMYNLVNTNSPLATTILGTEDKAAQEHL
jgi:molecular chaperone HtpG